MKGRGAVLADQHVVGAHGQVLVQLHALGALGEHRRALRHDVLDEHQGVAALARQLDEAVDVGQRRFRAGQGPHPAGKVVVLHVDHQQRPLAATRCRASLAHRSLFGVDVPPPPHAGLGLSSRAVLQPMASSCAAGKAACKCAVR